MVTTAFVGAGIVALGAGAMPDAKDVSSAVLDDLKQASVTSQDAAARADNADRASRDSRGKDAAEPEVWLLPLQGYDFNSPTGCAGASCTPASTWSPPRARRSWRSTTERSPRPAGSAATATR
ncbi:hypothetical protein GCM10027614_59350 [Micromonospora vulcania]